MLQVLAGEGIPLRETSVQWGQICGWGGREARVELSLGKDEGFPCPYCNPWAIPSHFFPSPHVPEEGSVLHEQLGSGGVSPPRMYRVQPLALRNFPEKQGDKADKRERCFISEVIQKLRHKNCWHCRVTQGDPLSDPVFQAIRSSTTFPPTPGAWKSALLLYFCQLTGTLYSKRAQAACIEFGLKTGWGISICQ